MAYAATVPRSPFWWAIGLRVNTAPPKMRTSLNSAQWQCPPVWHIQDYSDDDVRWIGSIDRFTNDAMIFKGFSRRARPQSGPSDLGLHHRVPLDESLSSHGQRCSTQVVKCCLGYCMAHQHPDKQRTDIEISIKSSTSKSITIFCQSLFSICRRFHQTLPNLGLILGIKTNSARYPKV